MTILAAPVADRLTNHDYNEYLRLSDELYQLVESKWQGFSDKKEDLGYEPLTSDEIEWISERIKLLHEQVDRIMAEVWA